MLLFTCFPAAFAVVGEALPVPISIDTYKASTARVALEAGARIVNDVSGGLADAAMLPAVAETDAEIIHGHWRGPSREMYAPAQYADVAAEVTAELGL